MQAYSTNNKEEKMEIGTIIVLIQTVLTAISLVVMFFGIRLGKRAMTKNLTLYGEKARQRLKFLKENALKGLMPDEYIYGGGKVTTPQLKIEKMTYDSSTMPVDWKKYTKFFQFFDKNKDNPEEIVVLEWRI